MILTDREIRIAIQRKIIVIDPEPTENAYSSTSVDLTLDPYLTFFTPPLDRVDSVIDPTKKKGDTETMLKGLTRQEKIPADGFVMNQNVLVLAYTTQYVDLRNDTKYAARVEGKSSLARIGLSHHCSNHSRRV